MLRTGFIALALLFLAVPGLASERPDPCSAVSSTSDVRFSLALKDHPAIFREGEIIPLELSFTSTAPKRYWADDRNYDRSGRLWIEQYCVDPVAPDPLESYFKGRGFIGGGLGGTRELSTPPFTAQAELNEWRSLAAGHYRVYAISNRVWRPPDPREQTPYSRVSEVVRSNTIDVEVRAADPAWQAEQLRSAVQTLTGSSPAADSKQAARRLRFLNSKDSTRQLARLFWGLNQQPSGWDFMLGLYGSPHRQLAIEAMRAELAVSDHAITSEFLDALVNLQVSADPKWDPPAANPASPDEVQAFWDRRRAHTQELTKTEVQAAVAALSRKIGNARALTLDGLLTAGGADPGLAQAIRPALVAAWADLPGETQQNLIQYRWPLIAGPEMLPILRRILAAPLPGPNTLQALARDAALKHLYELDPTAGREAILRDLQDKAAQPGLEVIKLLSKDDQTVAERSAVNRIRNHSARELDYELVDRYDDGGALGAVQAAFEERRGKWACAQQSAMLRYFLRVDPEYGTQEVGEALSARKNTGCYKRLLQDLGSQLTRVQRIALDALDDPDTELAQDAARALGRWGTPDLEKPLWERLQRFHREWAGREEQLRPTPEYQSAGSRGIALEQELLYAIAKGTNWICGPDQLARLANLVWTKNATQQVVSWTRQWKQDSVMVNPAWYPEDNPTFSVLQYDGLTEGQLYAKVAQFPRGTKVRFQFWQPGQIQPPVSMEKQEAFFERLRAIAEGHGILLEKANHP